MVSIITAFLLIPKTIFMDFCLQNPYGTGQHCYLHCANNALTLREMKGSQLAKKGQIPLGFRHWKRGTPVVFPTTKHCNAGAQLVWKAEWRNPLAKLQVPCWRHLGGVRKVSLAQWDRIPQLLSKDEQQCKGWVVFPCLEEQQGWIFLWDTQQAEMPHGDQKSLRRWTASERETSSGVKTPIHRLGPVIIWGHIWNLEIWQGTKLRSPNRCPVP